jgi:tRNA(Arg) A34 adenosine deaminase TadA
MSPRDLDYLRIAIEVAAKARAHGNHPFGAVLVDGNGQVILEAENTVLTGHDCTGHAETNLVRQACAAYPAETLRQCTLYTSTEPCAMCSGAIFWSGIPRVIFGLSERGLNELVEGLPGSEYFRLPCREVFARGNRVVEVTGPLIEEEARRVHLGFWSGEG